MWVCPGAATERSDGAQRRNGVGAQEAAACPQATLLAPAVLRRFVAALKGACAAFVSAFNLMIILLGAD